MNITPDTKVVWTQHAKAHRIEKGYSALYFDGIIRNPQEVVEQGADQRVVYGYGYGAVIALKGSAWYIIACFTDKPREGAHAAAA